jgi:hypothetical protein
MISDRPWFSAFSLMAMVLASCAGAVEKLEAEPPLDDGWAFSYTEKGRDASPALDLRWLNEPIAGQSGFVKLSADGNGFALGDGSPVRFWAIGSDVYMNPSEDEIKKHVKFLARMGVNMVRLHTQIAPMKSKITDVNEQQVDGIWRFVAAAKRQGIYVTISPYWASSKDATRWGIEGYGGPSELWGLLFFDETLQKGYKAWATALYARPNPYTGIPLAEDPSVAIIQIQNEDSLLFWTTDTMKPVQRAKLGQKFAEWLVKKYGSLEAAKKAWGGATNKDDNFAQGKVGLVIIYDLTLPNSNQRAADQLEFYATHQRQFYAEMAGFYRETLHCRQLINASNWKTASQTLLDDAERWSYTTTDVIAVNRYYNGGVHMGPNEGWRIDPGDRFSQTSGLLNPRDLPMNLKQVVGHPMIITESTWVSPLAFQSEGPFLASVYQSLTGVDVFYWFSADDVQYKTSPFFPYQQVKGQQPLLKWTASIPAIMGGFPANALLFRKGYVKQGETVVHEERTLKSIWERKTPVIAEDPSFDPNRDKSQAAIPKPGEKVTAVDPLAFLVGPVEVKYEGDSSKTRVADLSVFIDRDKKRIKSNTDEITLDYNIGLCTVDAPKAQGACGFLDKADLIKLSTLSIRSANKYATILAVSLDDLPLATSKKVLIQVGTANRPTGWSTKVVDFKDRENHPLQGYEVVNTGTPPWRVANSEFGISLKNPGLTKATLINPAGYAVEDVAITKAKTGVTIVLPTDTMYLILE